MFSELLATIRRTPAAVHRQEAPTGKSDEEKLKEAAHKAGEAFLKTPLGKDIKQRAAAEGELFLSMLPGKVVTGADAAGTIASLAATDSKLPTSIPEIPLDSIKPGLSVKLDYEGPVTKPTKVAITFSGRFDAPPAAPVGRAPLSERDRFRAETARLAEDQRRFREGLKTPQERADERAAAIDYAASRARDPSSPLYLSRVGVQPPLTQPAPVIKPESGRVPPPPPGVQPLKAPPPPPGFQGPKRKREDETVQRKARPAERRQAQALDGEVPGVVYAVLGSSGQTLDAETRRFMEARFGHDFGGIRIHTGPQAAESARAVNALAYTVGRDVVFDAGQYAPGTPAGRLLLAHELAHTIQQGAARPLPLLGPIQGQTSGKVAEPEAQEQIGNRKNSLLSPLASAPGDRPGAGASDQAREPGTLDLTAGSHHGGQVAVRMPPVPLYHGAPRLARKKKQGNPAEEQEKEDERKRLKKELGVVEIDDRRPPKGQEDKVRRFGFDKKEPYVIPNSKGKGPKSRPVLNVWKERADADALEAHMDITGTAKTALKQERDPTQNLRASWLTKVGWPQDQAEALWAAAGEKLKLKVEGFRLEGGQGTSARFTSTKAGGKTADFDHIVELQFGGTNIANNIQVLDPSPNRSSGGTVRGSLEQHAEDVKSRLSAASRGKVEVVILHWATVDQATLELTKDDAPASFVEQIAGDLAPGGKNADKSSDGLEVERYPIVAGGASPDILLVEEEKKDPKKPVAIAGSNLVENVAASTIIPGAVLATLNRKKGKTRAPDTIDAYLDTENPKTRLPITMEKTKKNAFTLNVDPKTRELKLDREEEKHAGIAFIYPYLSKGTMDKLTILPDGGLGGEGTLRPSVPLLNRLRLKVAFAPGEFRIAAGLDPEKVSPPIPGAKITEADLTLALLPEFDPKGVLAFYYAPGKKKLLDSKLKIGKDQYGLSALGEINVYIPGVETAKDNTVKYSNREWTGGARIAATQLKSKLKYVDSGEVNVGFGKNGIYADGKVRLAIPHTEGVEAGIKRLRDRWVFSGKGKFNLPRLEPVTLWFTYDGDHIAGGGEAKFKLHGLRGRVKVDYYDEKFSGEGGLDFEKGRAKGHLAVKLDRKGKFSGEGSLTYQVTESLVATAGAILDDKEKLTLKGSLLFTKPIPLIPLNSPIAGDYEIFGIGIKIPIPGASIAGIGINAKIAGSLSAGYQIGPGEVRNARVDAVGSPLEDNPDLEIQVSGEIYVRTMVYVTGKISGEVELSVLVASVAGGLTVSATAMLKGEFKACPTIKYSKSRLEVNSNFALSLGLLIGLALTAWAKAEAGVWRFKVTTRKDWKLASKTIDTGLKLEVRLLKPLSWASDTGLHFPPTSDIEIKKPNIDAARLLEQIFSSSAENEVED